MPPGPRFQLCTLDLDGTLIRTTCFQAVASAVGKLDEVRRLDDLYLSGRQSLRDNFWAEYALFEGLPVATARTAVRAGPWLRGIPEGVQALRAAGLRVGLLTDQPEVLAREAEPTLDPLLCSRGGVADGVLTRDLDYREDKLAHLEAWCREHRIPLSAVVHCGNGSNDVPVFRRVGLAVAVNPAEPGVAEAAQVVLKGVDDLRTVAAAVAGALGARAPGSLG